MKNIKFLLGLLAVVMIMAGCATTQGVSDDEYLNNQRTQQIGNRVYLQDPYYGTVVLERDPFTGRYYDVTNGSRFGTGFSNGYPYGGGFYRSYPKRGYFRNGTVRQQPQSPSRQDIQKDNGQARKKILGN